jgi:hypothetical protein
MAARALAEVREGVATARAARLEPPAAGAGRLLRVGYGMGLPLAILRAVWSSAAARRAYVRVMLAQIATVLAGTTLAVACAHMNDDDPSRKMNLSIDGHGVRINTLADDSDEDEPDTPAPPEEPEDSGDSGRIRLRKVTAAEARRAAAAAPPAPEGALERARAWLSDRVGPAVAFWSEVYATLGIVEWIVIALSREYHDALSKTASELSGVPPEETPPRPSIRLNVRWLMKKMRRRVRGLLLVGVGAPALWPLWIALSAGSALLTALLGAWGVYWLLVFTVGKTEHAWSAASPPDPWYVRWAERAARHRVLRFWIWPWYARLLRWMGTPLFAPAAHLERAPYEVVGLAIARALTRLPGLYTIFRPIIPVAATHVVVGPGRLADSGSP